MRKINTGDVFKLARIIKATGAKEDIINIYSESKKIKEEIRESTTQENSKEKNEEAQEKIGINIFFAIFIYVFWKNHLRQVYDKNQADKREDYLNHEIEQLRKQLEDAKKNTVEAIANA